MFTHQYGIAAAFLLFFVLGFTSFVSAQKCLSGDCINGNGTVIYLDHTIYIGGFRDGHAEGEGSCYHSNGNFYKGQWKQHRYHGVGTLRYPNGATFSGLWQNGELTEQTFFNAPERPRKLYAVVVGVADYNNQHMKPLNYTDDDAHKIYSFYKSLEGGALPDENIQILVDDYATRANIIEAMHTLFSKAQENDVIMFYFSGHGLKDGLLPVDFDGKDQRLYHEEVMTIINSSVARHKVCMIDACHAGQLSQSIPNFDAENDQFAMKGSIERILERYYKSFDQAEAGTALVLSSKAEESSIEHKGIRQGVFTHFLIKGLGGEADADLNKVVTLRELFLYLERSVIRYTSNYQHPILMGNADESLPLSIIR